MVCGPRQLEDRIITITADVIENGVVCIGAAITLSDDWARWLSFYNDTEVARAEQSSSFDQGKWVEISTAATVSAPWVWRRLETTEKASYSPSGTPDWLPEGCIHISGVQRKKHDDTNHHQKEKRTTIWTTISRLSHTLSLWRASPKQNPITYLFILIGIPRGSLPTHTLHSCTAKRS